MRVSGTRTHLARLMSYEISLLFLCGGSIAVARLFRGGVLIAAIDESLASKETGYSTKDEFIKMSTAPTAFPIPKWTFLLPAKEV